MAVIHTMRMLLFKIFGLDVDITFDDVIITIRNSVYFMGKEATMPIDELAIQSLEYAYVLETVQDIVANSLPIKSKLYMFYMYHLLFVAPDGYGLIPNQTLFS